MAIAYDRSEKLFQVDYQSPFGGIDSSAYASAIDPRNFVSVDSIYVEDNIIKSLALQQLGVAGTTTVVGVILGYVPVSFNNTTETVIGYVITDKSIYAVQNVVGPNQVELFLQTSYVPALSGFSTGFSYVVINEVQTGTPSIYWTTNGWNEIWKFNTTTNVASLLTNYVGGGVLALLQNQLLNLGGVSAADGVVPNRISWSAPGQYGQFQPYNVALGTGNYAAGFNDLPSVSDLITGFAAIGTVGYLFRNEGITQITPTGNGVQPFQFNHLWASELGIGTAYPNSISQYGTTVCFVADSGIYSLSLAGLQEIGQVARTYLYKIFNNSASLSSSADINKQLKARIIPYLQSSPELYYIVAVAENIVAGNGDIRFVAISVENSAVYDLGKQLNTTVNTRDIMVSFVHNGILQFTTPSVGTRQVNFFAMVSTLNGATYTPTFYIFNLIYTKTGTIVFRKEQLKFGYIPTITKIAVLGALVDITHNGTISISIDGGLNYGTRTGPNGETLGFPDIVITAGVGNTGQGIIDNIYSDGVVSLQRPQLALKLTNVQIAEAWYQGTLADFSLI